MAAWNYDQFQKNLLSVRSQKGQLNSFYLFYGEEIYLVDKALKSIKALIFENSSPDFNLDVFYGGELDVEQLSSTVETLPMMGERRLIIVKEADLLKASDLEKISEVVSVPYDTSVLILIFEKIDQRKKIFKDLFKKMTTVHFAPVGERLIPSWIDRIAREYGKNINNQVALGLQALVGERLIDLNNEIKKLVSYIGDKKNIEMKDVEAVVSQYRVDSIFELTNAIADKKTEEALRIQKYLLDQGESEVGILAMITRHIRILLLTNEGLENRLVGGDLAQYIGVPPFFVNQYVAQAKKWKSSQLQNSFYGLLECDRNLKSSRVSPDNFLTQNILNLTQA